MGFSAARLSVSNDGFSKLDRKPTYGPEARWLPLLRMLARMATGVLAGDGIYTRKRGAEVRLVGSSDSCAFWGNTRDDSIPSNRIHQRTADRQQK